MGTGKRSTFWHTAVNIRGLALPSAAKSNESHYQFMVFVCVCNQGAYADNSADVVGQLLILHMKPLKHTSWPFQLTLHLENATPTHCFSHSK